MPPQKPGFSFFNKEFQWVDYRLHTNEACWELNSQLNDRYLFSGWLGRAVPCRIQNTRVQFNRALHDGSNLS